PATRLPWESGRLLLPNGSSVKVAADKLKIVRPDDRGFMRAIERHARFFQKTTYLWGGKTQHGIDCSGFMQSLFLQEGILLPRDANMQANMGEIVGYLPRYADLLPGDLVFFMNEKAYVFHVGIYVGDGHYLHSSGSKNI